MNPSVHTDDARFVALLERWLQGDFTRADERELHALTEADDFRREAWEGFMALPEGRHELHLQALRRRLGRRPGYKRIPIFMRAAAAASFVVLLLAIYFFPRFSQEQAPQVAKNVEPVLPEGVAGALDSLKQDYAVAEETAAHMKSKSPAKVYPGQGTATAIPPVPDLLATAEDAGPEMKKEDEITATPVLSAPRVTDSVSSHLGGPAAGQQQILTTPAAFPPGGPAQNMPLKPETVRYDPVPSKPVETRRQPRAEADDKTALREAGKKKSDEPAPQATPAGGWDNFRRYLRDNARLTEAARNNNVSGYVVLQFWVGQDGKPANLIKLRSLGYGCDEEAIRLINTVTWTPVGPGPTVVEVPFVR